MVAEKREDREEGRIEGERRRKGGIEEGREGRGRKGGYRKEERIEGGREDRGRKGEKEEGGEAYE